VAWRAVPSGGASQRPRPQAYELRVFLRLQRSRRQCVDCPGGHDAASWPNLIVRLRSSVRAARLINLRTESLALAWRDLHRRQLRLVRRALRRLWTAAIRQAVTRRNARFGSLPPYPPFSASTSACASAESHLAPPSTAATSHPSLSITRVTGSPSALPSLCRVSKASPLESR